MRKVCWLLSPLAMLLMPLMAQSAAVTNSLIVNEFNGVSGNKYIKDDAVDQNLGRLEGNGQNWIEFLVVQGDNLGGGSFSNTLDLRGWTLNWSYNKDLLGVEYGSGTITFTNDPLWAAVPRGTMLTVSEWEMAWYDQNLNPGGGAVPEDPNGTGHARIGGIGGLGEAKESAFTAGNILVDLSTDTSWNPNASDWNIHVFAGQQNSDTSFKYFTFAGSVNDTSVPESFAVPSLDGGLFAVNNDNWEITIKDSSSNVIQGPVGERYPGGNNLGSDEVFKLENFSALASPTQADYLSVVPADLRDGTSSTFGSPNKWSAGSLSQDFSPLRDYPVIPGDADLDGDVDNSDIGSTFGSFTGPAGAGKIWGQGNFDGDGDVDNTDIGTVFGGFTGPLAGGIDPVAGNLTDSPLFADLIYDSATGNVKLDATEAAGAVITNFVLKNGGNAFLPPANMPFVSFFTTNTVAEISQSDGTAVGFGGVWDLGDVFPTGLTLVSLEAFLTTATYVGSLGSGVQEFDLIVLGPMIPEPSTLVLASLGLLGLVGVSRRRLVQSRRAAKA